MINLANNVYKKRPSQFHIKTVSSIAEIVAVSRMSFGNVPFRNSSSLLPAAVLFASQASLGQNGKLGANEED